MEESKKKKGRIYPFIKRVLDLFFSFLLLLLFLPVLLILLLVNAIATKGHPLFIQLRSGRNDKPFRIVKFRSMKLEVPSYVTSEELEAREGMYFRFGYFLKRTHLDELPQLWNILLGQMSFVGPRPGLTTQTDLIGYRKENGSIALRPGLTGLAQIAADNYGPLSQKEKSVKDKEYLDRISFPLDIKIVFLTFAKVFSNLTSRRRKRKKESKKTQGE